jgi:CheY-like chemotaxis protein
LRQKHVVRLKHRSDAQFLKQRIVQSGKPGPLFRTMRQCIASGARMSAASVTVLPRRTPPTILVVEDDVRVRCLVSDELRGSGFKVLEAGSAEEALTVLEAVRVDLLFMALDPQGSGSGVETARRVGAQQKPMRIIVASADGDGSEDLDLGDLGLLIRKPYRASQVVDLVIRSLNWPEPP